jgi:hypothetical protein
MRWFNVIVPMYNEIILRKIDYEVAIHSSIE